jgi:hypothetical protein
VQAIGHSGIPKTYANQQMESPLGVFMNVNQAGILEIYNGAIKFYSRAGEMSTTRIASK